MSSVRTQSEVLFEKYSNVDAVSLLQSLTNLPEKTFENDWLDFKSGKTQDQDLKIFWSKIIGAFANSEGGVIVWGVVAKKDLAKGIDAVSGVEPVPDIFALKSRLMELRHEAGDPPVSNIKIRELLIPGCNTEGFVICHVPESSNKPHRSEFSDRRFYLRMGDSSRECNVSILRQLFYPKRNIRIKARIQAVRMPNGLNMRITRGSHNVNHIRAAFEIGVHNIGETSVEDVQFGLKCQNYKLFKYQWNNYSKEYDVEFLPEVFSFGSTIHPTVSHSIYIIFTAEAAGTTNEQIAIRVFAKDMLPRKALLPFLAKEGESASIECFH
jgi:Putative DNA-binding domain